MAVGYKGLPVLHPVAGFRLGVASAGIKKPGRRDVVVMEIAHGSNCAGVFTRNAFCAAPVVVARRHLASSSAPRYLLVNTGNANAGTGTPGIVDAQSCCEALAAATGSRNEEVLPFSTGVIGEPLPVAKIVAALPQAVASLSASGWEEAAHGIMTTDTVPKGASRRFSLDGREVTITGITKGAGMIRPDMATMLAFIATDAAIESEALQAALRSAVEVSFNKVTIDGDTSTNDACILVATGASGVEVGLESPHYALFMTELTTLCTELAQLIVRDGEGATKFVTVDVRGGRDAQECELVAYAIAHSPLVKTALFASDPNWGRILAAVGRAGVPNLDLGAITIHLDEVCIVSDGGRDPNYREELGQRVVKREEFSIIVNLARGDAAVQVWTCDFSYDYVKINAEYRS